MTSKPSGAGAVMAERRDPTDSLDLFPTPPWATRALLEHVLCVAPKGHMPHWQQAPRTCWEPAAGLGHMAAVLGEYFDEVWRSDVHDYGGLNAVGSFVGEGADVAAAPDPAPDWIITNPPFVLALDFALRALVEAPRVALLVRTAWLEGGARYERLFRYRPPSIVAQFCERVPMVKGRWDPEASTATAYAWVVWLKGREWSGPTRFLWIPPGCRTRLTRPDDVRRFSPAVAGGRLAAGESPATSGGPSCAT